MVKKREWLLNGATLLLTVCALFIGGVRIREQFFPPDPLRPTKVENWREYAARGHRQGPRDAAVTIVEFADFQCPVCRSVAPILKSIRERYPGDVALVFRHFPLSSHEHALPAARASECAAELGQFWSFHDALFTQADSIGKMSWVRFGSQAGIRTLNHSKNA